MGKKFGGALVDLGDVLVDHLAFGTDQKNPDEVKYNLIPEVAGSFEALKQLNQMFGGNVTIIYNAREFSDETILGWLTLHRLSERTGLPLERACRNKIRCGESRDKTRFLNQSSETHHGVTVVVDNRLEVISSFVEKRVKYPILFRPLPEEVARFNINGVVSRAYIMETWQQVIEFLNK